MSKLGAPTAQSSLSQGTRSDGISDEITCTVSANGEQDLQMPRVHRASTAVVHAPRPCKRATETTCRHRAAGTTSPEPRTMRPRTSTRDRLRPALASGALCSPQRRVHSECFCMNYTCSAALPLGPRLSYRRPPSATTPDSTTLADGTGPNTVTLRSGPCSTDRSQLRR